MFQRNDWVVGIASVLMGAFVIIRSMSWEAVNSLDPAGPDAIPVLLASGMIIIGIIHLVGSWYVIKGGQQKSGNWLNEAAELKPILHISLLSIIYILLIDYIGYLIATPLLIISIMWVVQVREIKKLLITGLSATVILFLLFYVGLKVKLPMGFLEIFL